MISVLIPTRKRPELLVRSIQSLEATRDSYPVEYLVAIDPDDDTPVLASLAPIPVTLDIAPYRYGYESLHLYYNQLADIAQGDWLLLWNDDAVMAEPGWAEKLASQPPSIVQTIHPRRFPAIPTAWAHHLGHFSLNRHCDSWWDEIGNATVGFHYLFFAGSHIVPDDETARERVYATKEFYGKENMALIADDIARLKEIL